MLDLATIFDPDLIEAAVREHYGLQPYSMAVSDLAVGPDDLSMDWRIVWEERAAVMEYDGHLTREQAEAQALLEVQDQMREVDARQAARPQ